MNYRLGLPTVAFWPEDSGFTDITPGCGFVSNFSGSPISEKVKSLSLEFKVKEQKLEQYNDNFPR